LLKELVFFAKKPNPTLSFQTKPRSTKDPLKKAFGRKQFFRKGAKAFQRPAKPVSAMDVAVKRLKRD
jgi:hypothetical protein